MSLAQSLNYEPISSTLKILNKLDYDKSFEECLEYFDGDELAAKVFLDKYALRDNDGDLVEATPRDMHVRIARELARIETKKFKKPMSFETIFNYLDHFRKLVPQGSPSYGIGNPYKYVSISNCFVVDSPLDSYGSILNSDEQLIQISKRRGGVGTDLSHIRPANVPTRNSARTSTGIIPFMERYSNSIREVGQNARRGALMLTLSVHHPEVLEFAAIKNDSKRVTGANISVRLTNEFLDAVDNDTEYEQRWPIDSPNPYMSKMVRARDVWDKLIYNAWLRAEPGLLFWDRIIEESPADCYGQFGYSTQSTNPCGELPLCPLDSCRLLAINLYTYVKNKFTPEAYFDYEEFSHDAQVAQRMMDNIVDLELEAVEKIIAKVESDPEPNNIKYSELNLWKRVYEMCQNGRRTGLGITALGDVVAALGFRYDSEESINEVEKIYKTLKLASYRSSVDMAKELGPFPVWDWELEKENPFINRIKDEDIDLYNDIKKHGRRNIANLTTAPVGSLSIETQTTSSIEPLFRDDPYERRKKVNPRDENVRVDFVDETGDKWQTFQVYHKPIKDWMKITGKTDYRESPYHGSCCNDLDWKQRVKLQSKAQRHIDHSISSTINLPANVSVKEVSDIYLTAWKAGCKGVTVYRDKCRDGVLIEKNVKPDSIIAKTDAPKRPKELVADIHHIRVKGIANTVLVGLLNDDPYEVMVVHGHVGKDSGKIVKSKRGHYRLVDDKNEVLCEDITEQSTDNEDALTRLCSTSLRHGTPIEFVVHQLSKVKGDDLHSFAKCISRSLKKYVKDGTKVSGSSCPQCENENMVFSEGCAICGQCGYSKCG